MEKQNEITNQDTQVMITVPLKDLLLLQDTVATLSQRIDNLGRILNSMPASNGPLPQNIDRNIP
jgi:hypothetical protein